MGNIHHIIDNFNEQVIVVTMENSSYELDFMKMYERIGMVEDNIINYIIPYIEKNYNVSKKASDRAFCGISTVSYTHLSFIIFLKLTIKFSSPMLF